MSAQLEMPGMPRRLFAATPSKLAAFADCPRRYRFAYLERPTPPKGPPWAHNTVGAAVHAALRSWWELPVPKRTTGAARQLLYSVWSRTGFRDDEQADRWRSRAAGWLTDYVAGLDPADDPVGTERTVGATTGRLALSGRVDRIDARDGGLVIVDYKTGRRVPDTDDARGSLALAVYALAAGRTLRRPCTTVAGGADGLSRRGRRRRCRRRAAPRTDPARCCTPRSACACWCRGSRWTRCG